MRVSVYDIDLLDEHSVHVLSIQTVSRVSWWKKTQKVCNYICEK